MLKKHKTNDNTQPDIDIIDIYELSRRIKRKVRSIRRDVANNAIPVIRITSRCHRFSLKAIQKWLDDRSSGPETE